MNAADIPSILLYAQLKAPPGDTTVIPAKPGFYIAVTWFFGTAGGPMNLTFRSNTTEIMGPLNVAKAGNGFGPDVVTGFVVTKTAKGEALVVHNDSATDTFGGVIHYFYNNA